MKKNKKQVKVGILVNSGFYTYHDVKQVLVMDGNKVVFNKLFVKEKTGTKEK